MLAYFSLRSLSGCSLLLLFLACQSGSSAAKTQAVQKPPAHELSKTELVEALREAKILDPSYSLKVTKTSDEVQVITQRNSKFDENDTKIQAVLIAKKIFDLVPKTIEKAKVIYQDQTETLSEVVVNRTEIKSYGSGEESEEDLLKSLDVSKVTPAAVSDPSLLEGLNAEGQSHAKVVDGPMKAYRQAQLTSIENLKSKGANMSKAEELFAAQEKLAEAGDASEVSKSFKTISAMVSTQRAMMMSAQASSSNLQHHGSRKATETKPNHKASVSILLDYMERHGLNVEKERDVYARLKDKDNDEGRALLSYELRVKAGNQLQAAQIDELNNLLKQHYLDSHPDKTWHPQMGVFGGANKVPIEQGKAYPHAHPHPWQNQQQGN